MRQVSQINNTQCKVMVTTKVANSEKQLIVESFKQPKAVLVEGTFMSYQSDNGWGLHGGSSRELVNSNVVSTAPISVIFTILLQGDLSFGYDDLTFDLSSEKNSHVVAVNLARPANFRRALFKNNQVTKLNIMLKYDWLHSRMSHNCYAKAFVNRHKNFTHFAASPEIVTLTRQLLKSGEPTTLLETLTLEALSHQLINTLFKQLENETIQTLPNDEEFANAAAVEDIISFIETHLEENLSNDDIALEFSMSPTNLQRKFKQHLGITLKSYVRGRRLDIAKHHLEQKLVSVTQAAYDAGYAHPANFTIAFKKKFGYPPTQTTTQAQSLR
ncbi:helix-turn-helix domain-containing protein [Vibrio sinensis]|nr:AraC family transcriptional regulator [Vibrio sinensis]